MTDSNLPRHAVLAELHPGERPETTTPRTILRPTTQAAATVREYSKRHGDLELMSLIECLNAQTEAANDGDLGRAEEMLIAQAHSLDAIFNALACRAINSEYMEYLEPYLKLGLRAQSQCRATLEALAAIKNPPLMGYVQQANIAHGHQQVNNAPPVEHDHTRTREKLNLRAKLMEQDDGERLDRGATGAPGRDDPALAPVGKIDRAANRRR